MATITKFARTAPRPIPFGRLFPGSLFSIHAELSRGMKFSRDNSIYRKAREHQGFYAYDYNTPTKVACLMPEDLVWPLRKENK